MNRRKFFASVGGGALALGAVSVESRAKRLAEIIASGQSVDCCDFDPTERSLGELASAQANGNATAESLVRSYLKRIADLDQAGPELHAVLSLNPDAIANAQSLDAERKGGKVRSPLHGIPLLLKDNIETLDPIPTTAGSLALVTARHVEDAPAVAKLRSAGAIVLGKANLTEWANVRSPRSVSGWSAVGGQTRHAYDSRRNPSGSSSGSAVGTAASLCAAALGTETDASVLAPASINGIVGLKPTAGLVSNAGVVPISHRQDTIGPLGRSVLDVALLILAMSNSAATSNATITTLENFPLRLRIGVLPPASSAHPEVISQSHDWLRLLEKEGAELVDILPPNAWADMPQKELEVLLYECKASLDGYLARLTGVPEVKSLSDLIAFNKRHAGEEMLHFGQEYLEQADKMDPLTSKRYRSSLRELLHRADVAGLGAIFSKHKVDVLVAAGNGPAELVDQVWGDRYETSGGWPPMASAAAVAGYPSLTVPAGFVQGLPVGMAFVAPRFKDLLLLRVGRTFERASTARRPPHFGVVSS